MPIGTDRWKEGVEELGAYVAALGVYLSAIAPAEEGPKPAFPANGARVGAFKAAVALHAKWAIGVGRAGSIDLLSSALDDEIEALFGSGSQADLDVDPREVSAWAEAWRALLGSARGRGRASRDARGWAMNTNVRGLLARLVALVLLLSALALPAALVLLGCGSTVADRVRVLDERGAKSELRGKPVPEVTAEYITGEGPKTLAEARGKVVVLEFWATWCKPCRRSFPEYQGLLDRRAGDIAVLGVNVDDGVNADDRPAETRARILAFALATGTKFSLLRATEPLSVLAKRYGAFSVPMTLVIDRTGVVRAVQFGWRPPNVVAAEVDKVIREEGTR